MHSMEQAAQRTHHRMLEKNEAMLFDSLPLIPKQVEEIDAEPLKLVAMIVIDGKPQGKDRPRARVIKNRETGRPIPVFYNPTETTAYEERIAYRGRVAYAGMPILQGVPIGLVVRVYLEIPESWTKRDKLAALRNEKFPIVKPDHDNFAKIASDALNRVIYHDDAQITDSHVTKRYSDNPRMEIEVYI